MKVMMRKKKTIIKSKKQEDIEHHVEKIKMEVITAKKKIVIIDRAMKKK